MSSKAFHSEDAADRYDAWFERNAAMFRSELACIRDTCSFAGDWIEIGVGTGRFAAALGIKVGVEPEPVMGVRARSRGIRVIPAVAEQLPVERESFDGVLMVTTLCFVDDAKRALQEVHRILRPGGRFCLAFIDREGPIGQSIVTGKKKSDFYEGARLYSARQMQRLLEDLGFRVIACRQTLFADSDANAAIEESREGFGEGSFVVIHSKKTPSGGATADSKRD